MSQGCMQAACMVLQNMDPCVNPCENFYLFACGSYIQNQLIPDDKSTVNIPHTISDQLEAKIRSMLEDENTFNNVRAFRLAKKLYATCMNLGRSKNLYFIWVWGKVHGIFVVKFNVFL